MKSFRAIGWVLVALLCISAGPANKPAVLSSADFDFKALLGDPPADGSQTQKQETAGMLALQDKRTHDEVARCEAEAEQSPYEFAAAIVGPGFDGKHVPLTNKLLIQVTLETKIVTAAAKLKWNRPRPYITEPRIKPCVELESTFSYPSGHATRGIVWGTILGEIFPEHREALLAHGRQYGTDRTLAGMHYPTDVIAGQKLGAEIARRLLADKGIQEQIEKAKAECAAAVKK